ncbi:hypothetical protein HK104_006722 [Borealophlyctis nickersoniae]|nr:hypothetical protein HK104_006722 [Borealophlyctis nickersoniae]
MSSRDNVLVWSQGVDAYAQGDIPTAMSCFECLSNYAKPLFNLAQLFLATDDPLSGVERLSDASAVDPYLALAYYQRGHAEVLLGCFEDAVWDYTKGLDLLNDNPLIDYTNLFIPHVLHRAELHYNRAVCHNRLGDYTASARDLALAGTALRASSKSVSPHADLIDRATRVGLQDDATVLFVPYEAVFDVGEAKRRNLGRVMEDKKAEIVVGRGGRDRDNDTDDEFVGFSGERLVRAQFDWRTAKEFDSDDEEETFLRRNQTLPLPRSKAVTGNTEMGRAATLPTRGSRGSRGSASASENGEAFGGMVGYPRPLSGDSRTVLKASSSSPLLSPRGTPPPAPFRTLEEEDNDVIDRVADYLSSTFGLDPNGAVTATLPKVLKHGPYSPTSSPTPSVLRAPPNTPASPLGLTPPPPRTSSLKRSVTPLSPSSPLLRTGSHGPLSPSSTLPRNLRPSSPSSPSPRSRTFAPLSPSPSPLRKLDYRPLGADEYGYGYSDSDGYDTPSSADAYSRSLSRSGSLMSLSEGKLKLKIHTVPSTTLLLFTPPNITLSDLTSKVATKLGATDPAALRFGYRDEEGTMISMVEDEDLAAAVEAKGGKGKGKGVDLWCWRRDEGEDEADDGDAWRRER